MLYRKLELWRQGGHLGISKAQVTGKGSTIHPMEQGTPLVATGIG